MNIQNSTLADIEAIFSLYTAASDYQKSKETVVVWPDFDPLMVKEEIKAHKQFKLLIGNEIACVWAITFTDEVIWQTRNADASLYIHRIARHPKYTGKDFVKKIVHWAKGYAVLHQKRYIRLDTVGNNPGLIRHYTAAGFQFLGMVALANVEQLPPHYKEGPCCLFEIDTLTAT